jgi:hypothetical protein
MVPTFLFPETEVSKDGESSSVAVDFGSRLQLTLGINDAIEQGSLDVQILGSTDGAEWLPKPIAAFPQKFYKGVYTMVLDLKAMPEVQHLKMRYKLGRWGHWTEPARFTFYVFAEPLRR